MRELQKLIARVVWSSYSSQLDALTIIYDGSSRIPVGAATLAFRVKAIDPLTPARIKCNLSALSPDRTNAGWLPQIVWNVARLG